MSREINSLQNVSPPDHPRIATLRQVFADGLNRDIWVDDGFFWHYQNHTAAGAYIPQPSGQQTIINGEEQYYLKRHEITGSVSHWPNNEPWFIRGNSLVLSAVPLSDAPQYNDIAWGVVQGYVVIRSTSNTVTVAGRSYYDRRVPGSRWGVDRYLTDNHSLRIVSNNDVYDVTSISNDTVDPDGTSGPTEHTITISGTFSTQPNQSQSVNVLRQQKYVSGCITPRGMFQQKYGTFKIRCKLPKGQGTFAAPWLYVPFFGFAGTENIDEDDKRLEVDFIEALGHATDIAYHNLHSPGLNLDGFFSSNTALDHSNATPSTAGWTGQEIQQHQVLIDPAHADYYDAGAEFIDYQFEWYPPADKNNPYGPSSVPGKIGNTCELYVKRDAWSTPRRVYQSYMSPVSFNDVLDHLMPQFNMAMESNFNYDQEINDASYPRLTGTTAAPWEFEIETFEVFQWPGEVAGGAGIHDAQGKYPQGFTPTPGDDTNNSGGGEVSVDDRRIVSKPVIGLDGAVEFSLTSYKPGETYTWSNSAANTRQEFTDGDTGPSCIIRAIDNVSVPTTDTVSVAIDTVELPKLVSPTAITDAVHTLTYSAGGLTVDSWRIKAGKTEEGDEYLDSGVLAANVLSVTNTTDFPQDGSSIYIEVQWLHAGAWYSSSTVFNAPLGEASQISFDLPATDGYLSNDEQATGILLTGEYQNMPAGTTLTVTNPGGALTFSTDTLSGDGTWQVPMTSAQCQSFPTGEGNARVLRVRANGVEAEQSVSRHTVNPVCTINDGEVQSTGFSVQVITDAVSPRYFDLDLIDSNDALKHRFTRINSTNGAVTFSGSAQLAATINASDQWLAVVTDKYGNYDDEKVQVQLEAETGPTLVQDLEVVTNNVGYLELDWEWDETTNGALEWGTTAALGNVREPQEPSTDQYSYHNQWLSAAVHGLPSGTLIYLRARGTNAAGGTSYTSIISVTTAAASSSDFPFGLAHNGHWNQLPSDPAPNSRHSGIDSVTGAKYRMIRDPNTGEYYRHAYSKEKPITDDDQYMSMGASNDFIDAAALTRESGGKFSSFQTQLSNTDPDVVYGCYFNGHALQGFGKYTISTDTYEQLYVGTGWCHTMDEGGLAFDDSSVCFVDEGRNAIIHFDIPGTSEIGTLSKPGGLDWAAPSPSGNYVVVKPGGGKDLFRYDADFTNPIQFATDDGWHASIGRDVNGADILFCGHDYAEYMLFSDPQTLIRNTVLGSGLGGGHGTCPTDFNGWGLLSTGAYSGPKVVIAVKLEENPSGTVQTGVDMTNGVTNATIKEMVGDTKLIAWSRSSANQNSFDSKFSSQPQAAIAARADRVFYHSDANGTGSNVTIEARA